MEFPTSYVVSSYRAKIKKKYGDMAIVVPEQRKDSDHVQKLPLGYDAFLWTLALLLIQIVVEQLFKCHYNAP